MGDQAPHSIRRDGGGVQRAGRAGRARPPKSSPAREVCASQARFADATGRGYRSCDYARGGLEDKFELKPFGAKDAGKPASPANSTLA